LNIPDFTRYSKSQREQALGQLYGLPTTMMLFSFVGVVVTSATVILYGEAIWDPVKLVERLARESGSTTLAFFAMLTLAIATLSTNIAANIVSPANSFSNAFPRRISFRAGGLIAAALGVLLCPWLILDVLIGWLVSYSGLLGAVGGVLIADYWLLRGTQLDLAGLYQSRGPYRYTSGFNVRAIAAMVLGIAAVLLGLVHPSLSFLFQGAWFSGFLVSATAYLLLMRGRATAR
ncbi:MAG: cytosine permease, partial [Myxococcales bacterium]|nr:cytosine permease [Myxococcales bacterium]